MGAIPVWASGKQFLVCGVETTPGTFSAGPFATLIVDEFKPVDAPVWLDDKGWRGSPTTLYGRQEGVVKTSFSLKGSCFVDTLGYLLRNMYGDVTYTGGVNSGAPTTTTSNITAGQTTAFTVSSGTGISIGTVLAIGSGATLELITATTGTTGTSVVPAGPFVYAHASGATVQVVTGPFSSTFANLTSGTAQPNTLSLAHFLGPTATTMARVYTGACLSDISFTINPETSFVTFDAKGVCWPSQPDLSTPTPNPTSVAPIAAWRAVLGVGGVASGGTQIKYMGDCTVDVKRKLDVIFTGQNSQNPYVITRGELDCSGKLNFVAVPDESQFLNMLNNSQPQLQLLIDNGQAGVNHGLIQFDSQITAYKDFVPDTGKSVVGYTGGFDAIANTTNIGASGGYSPGKLTLLNNVSPQSY